MLDVGVMLGAVALGEAAAVGDGTEVGGGVGVGLGVAVFVGGGDGTGVGVWQGKSIPQSPTAYEFFTMVKELKAAIPNSKSARTPIIMRKRVKRIVTLRLPHLPRSRCWEEISDWSEQPDSCLFFFIAEILPVFSILR
jgi:hypothetical protein